MRFTYSLFALLCCGPVLLAQEKTVARFIEFRDGSVLRLSIVEEPWKVHVIRGTGKIDEVSLLPSQIQSLALTQHEDFSKKRHLLSLVQQLGSESFRRREEAHRSLLKLGPSIRADLQACMRLSDDTETQVRLHTLLNELPESDKPEADMRIAFDRLQIKAPRLTFTGWGFMGEQPIRVIVDGKKYTLQRKDVARLTESIKRDAAATTARMGFSRIGPEQFPKGCMEESFETDPATGRKLRVGENIEKLFISKGFVLSTSIKTSYVSVNTYTVAGKSKGWSAATHEPLWHGEITVRFNKPGHEHIPVGVTHFGCYIAAVVPDGTHLIAFDRHDNEVGQVSTQQNGTDFLGFSSVVPIYKVRFVPDPTKDRDYTVDDFIYKFAPVAQTTHKDKFMVHLTGGDLILCKDVRIEQGKLHLHGLPANLPEWSLPLAQLERVNAPQKESPKPQDGMYAELQDGSIVFGPQTKNAKKRPHFPRRPDLLKDGTGIAGVWTAKFPPLPAPLDGKGAAIWSAAEQKWQPVQEVRFLEEEVAWKTPNGASATASYENLPPLWLNPPKEKPEMESWRVRTVDDEELVVAGKSLNGRLSDGLRAVWQGQPVTIRAGEIAAIYQAAAGR